MIKKVTKATIFYTDGKIEIVKCRGIIYMDFIACFDNMDDTRMSVPYANIYKINEEYIEEEAEEKGE